MRILPGKLHIWNSDGELMRWKDEMMTAEITGGIKVMVAAIYIGDNTRPAATHRLPPSVTNGTHQILEDFLTERAEELKRKHVDEITGRLLRQRQAYREIILRKNRDMAELIAGGISEDAWTYRLHKNNEYLSVCEELQMGFLTELEQFNPPTQVIFVFTRE